MTATLKTTVIQEPSSATQNIVLGTSGQVGFGGANYGTSGQVLTSGGASAGPSWFTPTPVGAVISFAGSAAPSGWLLLFGQNVSRTTYADLFAVIGTTYGAGDGSTTFALPDLRGRASLGVDNMGGTSANRITAAGSGITGTTLGATGGLETHTLTIAQMPAHTHTANFQTTNAASNVSGAANITTSPGNTGSTGGGLAHNNVQPAIMLNYIIKT